MRSRQSRDEVNNIHVQVRAMHATEIKRRSLPETPTAFMEQRLQRTLTPLVSRSVSEEIFVEDLDPYTELAESLMGEPQVDPERTCYSGWREAINSAGQDELRALLTNVVSTLENGLPPAGTECQTHYESPGIIGYLRHCCWLTMTYYQVIFLCFNAFMFRL